MLVRITDDAPCSYAHIIDPFGHLWALAVWLPEDYAAFGKLD